MSKAILLDQLQRVSEATKAFIVAGDEKVTAAVEQEKLSRLEALQKEQIDRAKAIADLEKKLSEGEGTNTQAIEDAKAELEGKITQEAQDRGEAIEAAKNELEGKISQEAQARDEAIEAAKAELKLSITEPATDEDIQPILDLFTVPEE